MGKIQLLIDRLQKLSVREQDRILIGAVRKHGGDAVKLNQAQLLVGKNSDGGLLGRYSSAAYAKFKGHWFVNLRLTGKFFSTFFLKGTKFPLSIDAHDVKTPKLEKRYPKIFGLTKANQKVFGVLVREEIKKIYRRLLQLR